MYFLPALEFSRKALADGRIPVWNPHVLCGQPFVGNPQSAVFYPLTAFLPVMGATRFMSVSVVFHMAVAWSGTYRYARSFGMLRTGAVLAASSFVGGGAFLLRLQFPTMFQAMAWMPWIAFCSLRLADRPSVRRVAAMSAISALSFLAGHPQVSYLSCLLAIAVTAWTLRGRSRRQRGTWLASWTASLALGAAVAAAYWLPAVEVLRSSARPELALGKADRFAVGWHHLMAMMWPGYVGSPASGDYWAPGNVWEPALFIGLPQLALACVALRQWRRAPAVRLHMAIVMLALWLSFGVWGGLYAVAYVAVPGMSVFHDPARFGIPCTLGLACLAGIGADCARVGLGRWRPFVTVACVGALLAVTTNMTPTVRASELKYRPRLLAMASSQRLYSAMREETWDRYVNYADYGAESGRYVHELTDTVTPNIGMRYGLSDAGGYEPVPLKSATTIEGLLRQAVSSQSPAVVAMASMMNVGTVIMPVGLSTHIPSLAVLKSRKSVFDVAPSPPRQVVVYGHTRIVPDLQRTAQVLGTTGFPHGSVAIVSRATGLPEGMVCPAAPIRYRDLAWRPAHGGGDCIVSGLQTRGLVAISVSALPGWKASVDGVSVSPLRVNGAFLGVVTPPGDHTVRVRYQPTAFRVGLFLTLIGLLSLAAIGTAGAIVMPRGEGKLGSSRTT